MKNRMVTLTAFISLMLISACSTKKSIQRVKQEIAEVFGKTEGIFALAFKDLSNGEMLLINEHDLFHAASTMKTPVMIEVYKQANAGNFSLVDSIKIRNEFFSIVDSSRFSLSIGEDSEEMLYSMLGKSRSIYDLMYDMIIVSSNLATNLIIDLVDAQKVTQTMRDLGANDIEVLRGVEDIKAYELGLSNSTTAYDLLIIFEKLAQGEVVNPSACEEMIKILKDQKFNDIIPAQLPKEIKVAHKTGAITGVHHDSGIIFLPDGRKYILVLLSKQLNDFDKGTRTLASVSKMIYDYMN